MSSPGHKRGNCGHAMASFDGHSFCARCHDMKKVTDTCVETPTADCKFCLLLTPEQKAQFSTPSYKLKKETTDTGSPHLHQQSKDSASIGSSEAGSDLSDRPPVDLFVEEGELSDEQDIAATEKNKPDQTPSAEQTYRETMRGIRSYMGWSNIPDVNSSNTASDDNPFSGPKAPVPGKVSVTMPTEDLLCKKLSKLNVTLTEGYPTRSTEAGRLMKDQFLRPAKSQSRWYALHSEKKGDSSTVAS